MDRMSLVVLVGASLLAPLACGSESREDPRAVMKRVDAAAKAVTAVQYKVRFTAPDGMTVEGTVQLSGWQRGAPDMFRSDATIRTPGAAPPTRVTLGSDGATYYVIDHRTRTAHVGTNPWIFGAATRFALRALHVLEFVHPEPFSEEIHGDKLELRADTKVAGEPCYEVHVVYAGGQREATWSIAKNDFLPRGISRALTSSKDSAQRWIISELVANPTVATDAFAMKRPDGYSESRTAAP